jgi:protease I
MRKLSGKHVAILVTDGFEQVELFEPRNALEDEGAATDVVSPARGRVRGWKFTEWGRKIPVDVPLERAKAEYYDALLLPGGVMSPDKLRVMPEAIKFIQAFAEAGKPIAAICHGAGLLIDSGIAAGRTLTSAPSLKVDLTNAGAAWVDEEVVRDGRLVTSRKPSDIPSFSRMMIDTFAEGAPAPSPEEAREGEPQQPSP